MAAFEFDAHAELAKINAKNAARRAMVLCTNCGQPVDLTADAACFVVSRALWAGPTGRLEFCDGDCLCRWHEKPLRERYDGDCNLYPSAGY
jgi:hypothetical protein